MQQVINIPIRKIRANIHQPRLSFNQDSLDDLASSIKENGIIQPIIVRDKLEYYEIIAGERRFRACQMIGMETIPSIIMNADELKSAQLALIENIQRDDLSAIEEAKAYVQIMRESGCTQEELASQVGKTQSTIANKIRLLALPHKIQEAISNRTITERHGRTLLTVNEDKQIEVFEEIVNKKLNVAQSEKLVKNVKENKPNINVKTKAVARNTRIGLNTIYQAVKMVNEAGIYTETEERETDDYYEIVVKFPKG